ncbi:sugar phosphate nucleotidyltransferase [Paenibacillus sp. OV219]|uniref:sugar phosphate nucleotidyltransferase n=1 Tax=Paenibacillus sp. OV219 TaxID=1884377 RepID=UPI0008D7564A|nr:sugar phosphate nucleotidyltransferase [Paenibacillus sp. OV219]SEN81318.1 bifunctional UDP-N-acetylglucosamine pyrophosphorylase / Glucosamine-1-phosphate N-acetyltransferase [Paenibacillus sp. OV219]
MKTAVILAAGLGTKMWPFADIRPKAMIPVGTKPLIAHQVESLQELGFTKMIIVGGKLHGQIRNYFRENGLRSGAKNGVEITVLADEKAQGTALSLAAARTAVGSDEDFLVLYGDTLVDRADIEQLIASFDRRTERELAAALVNPLQEESSSDWICCKLESGYVSHIVGHPRGDYLHRFCAFAFSSEFWSYASSNSGLFTSVQVGMMPPLEAHLEMSLLDCMNDGYAVRAVETTGDFIDLDKPWHILLANELVARSSCAKLTDNVLAEGASIDPSASIDGFVQLGAGSRIGRNVIIEGNIIVGDRTIIENGAILKGNHIIGNDTYIGNYCFLSEGTTVGDHCVINHCAELEGVIFDTVYLYHYMEFYGVIGTSTDLGAATVCGTLRFDDGRTSHRIKGRKETPSEHSNAIYLGDFVRTGVNAILMPGVKVGVYSVVGSGVILEEDVPNRTLLYVKQDLVRKEWGPSKYGW